MDTINSRIEFLIKDLAITKTSFAEQLHVSVAFISGLCSGVKNPSDRTISDICRVFGVSEAWLRDGIEPMYVTRSMNEELARLVNDLMADADDSFRKRFITALLELPPEHWPEFEKFIKKISQNP